MTRSARRFGLVDLLAVTVALVPLGVLLSTLTKHARGDDGDCFMLAANRELVCDGVPSTPNFCDGYTPAACTGNYVYNYTYLADGYGWKCSTVSTRKNCNRLRIAGITVQAVCAEYTKCILDGGRIKCMMDVRDPNNDYYAPVFYSDECPPATS